MNSVRGIVTANRLVDIGGYRLHSTAWAWSCPPLFSNMGTKALIWTGALSNPNSRAFIAYVLTIVPAMAGATPRAAPRVPSVLAQQLHTLLCAAGEKPPYILGTSD
jgi:hypothetical protein